MPRYRTRVEIFRADTRELQQLAQWQGFAEIERTQDLHLVLPTSGSTVTIDPTTYGMTAFEEVYVETDQSITATLAGDATGVFQVDQFLLLRGTSLTAITLFSGWPIETNVHLILGGT